MASHADQLPRTPGIKGQKASRVLLPADPISTEGGARSSPASTLTFAVGRPAQRFQQTRETAPSSGPRRLLPGGDATGALCTPTRQRTQAASEGALDVEGLCSAFRTKAAVRVPDPVGHVPTCGLATGVLKPVAKPGDAWMSPPSAPRGRGNRELRALALEAHSGSAAEVPSAAKPGRVAAQAAGSGGAELAGDATACSRGNVVPALASQAGPALPYDTCRLGSVQALSPVKAGRGATDQLGSQTVLTPVRRSARTSCSKPLTPVGTLLEATSYSYTPNTYLQR